MDGEKIMRLLYGIWAREHGCEVKITRKEDSDDHVGNGNAA